MINVLVIDNIDSFVYNLVQYLGELGQSIRVELNTVTIEQIKAINPKRIVLSPGPGRPENAGNCIAIIKEFASKIPILGVCLGHQCIGQAFGANIGYSQEMFHGKVSKITHDGKSIFEGLSNPFQATRYHSLVVDRNSISKDLEITASCENGSQEVMGIRHKSYPIEGVQFHPESILTLEGKKLLSNFIKLERFE